MFTVADPLGAIADIVVGFHNSGIAGRWGKLIFGILMSFWLSFNTACGAALIAKQGWPISIGLGMITGSAMALTAYLRANPGLTKGIVIAVPQQTAADAVNSRGQGPEVITEKGKP